MPATITKMSASEIDDLIRDLPGWKGDNDRLTKVFTFSNFLRSMEFVNQLARKAEASQHHPDIDIRYAKVRIVLSTHDAGGVTDLDAKMAKTADELFETIPVDIRPNH